MQIKKVKRNYRFITGHVFRGEDFSGIFEGSYERDWILMCRYDPQICRIVDRPVQIKYTHPDGGQRVYTPDYLIEFQPELRRAPHLCEVKPFEFIRTHIDEYVVRFQEGVRYARANGWKFKVRHEAHIHGPLLDLARQIDRNREFSANDLEIQWLKSSLAAMGPIRIDEFFARKKDRSSDDVRRIVWAAIVHQKVAYTTDALISGRTVISVRSPA